MPLAKETLWVVDCEIAKMCFPFFANRSHEQNDNIFSNPIKRLWLYFKILIFFEFASVDEHGPVDGVEEDEEGWHEEDEGTIDVRGLQILPDRMLLQDWDRARGRLGSPTVVVQTSCN